MAKITLPTIAGGYASVTQLNTAFDQVETELQDKVLYRANPTGEPNQMENDLDMNSNDILNAGSIACSDLTVDGSSVASAVDAAQAAADEAALSKIAAAASATAAATSETNAAISATAVEDAKLIWRGAWSALTTYAINDAVSYNGSSWISLQNNNLNHTPTDDAYWDYLAEKGAAGAGTGDVIGPASATANSLARYDGTTGKLLKDGAIIGTDVQAYSVKLASYVSNTLTAANKVPYASSLNTAAELDFKDEDDMGSDSATALASQQSIKAYADTKNIATQVIPGASGNILTSNGTNWISASPTSAGALELVETWNATATASKIFNLQADTYCEWIFVGNGIVPSKDGAQLLFQMGYSGGTLFRTKSSEYASDCFAPLSTTLSQNQIAGEDSAQGVGSAGTEHVNFTFTLSGINTTLASGFTWEVKSSWIDTNNVQRGLLGRGCYTRSVVQVWDAIKFLWVIGNFEASGSIKMFALKRAG